MKFNFFRLISLIIIPLGCHVNSVYNNREQDLNDAEKITTEFYDLIMTNQTSKTYKLFHKGFYSVTDTNKLNKVLNSTNQKLGVIKSVQLENATSQVIKGTDERGTYVLKYSIKREKFSSKETFELINENGIIKISSYNINSDGLITQ